MAVTSPNIFGVFCRNDGYTAVVIDSPGAGGDKGAGGDLDLDTQVMDMSGYKSLSEGLRQKARENSIIIKMSERRDNDGDQARQGVHIFCFNLQHLSRSWQFIILTTITFVFYLVYGYFQVSGHLGTAVLWLESMFMCASVYECVYMHVHVCLKGWVVGDRGLSNLCSTITLCLLSCMFSLVHEPAASFLATRKCPVNDLCF
jgi:hypothetical protein